MLFIDSATVKAYSGVNKVFYNPKMEKISIIFQGEPNELYSHAMVRKDRFEQLVNLFGSHDSTVRLGQFMNERYALFVDLRDIHDNMLNGGGRPLQRLSDGITLHITKKADGTEDIRFFHTSYVMPN